MTCRQELIAQTPLEQRDGSRLMTLDKTTGAIGHHHFYDLPQFLRPGDCLVLNNSRVLPARLIGHRAYRRRRGGAAAHRQGGQPVGVPGAAGQEAARRCPCPLWGRAARGGDRQEVLPDGNRLVKFLL